MTSWSLTKMFYLFLARLDDDPLIDGRTREHAHQLRQEMLRRNPRLDKTLPKPSGVKLLGD